jgi:hypothetical protein
LFDRRGVGTTMLVPLTTERFGLAHVMPSVLVARQRARFESSDTESPQPYHMRYSALVASHDTPPENGRAYVAPIRSHSLSYVMMGLADSMYLVCVCARARMCV